MQAVNKQALPNQCCENVNKQGKPRAHDILNLASNLFHLFPVVVVVFILCHAPKRHEKKKTR